MTNYTTKYCQIVTFIFIFSLVSACSGRSLDARGREELKYSRIVDTESSEKELFADAINAYDNGQYNNCAQVLEVLLNSYPEGEFLEPAKLKLIDAKFNSGNFSEVVKLVEEFLDLFPQSPAVPYLLTLAGMSYEQTYGGVGRDPSPLQEAKQYYERIVKEYPKSDYSLSAEKSLQKINHTLVSYQDYLVQYYQKQQLPQAAIVREKKKGDLKSQEIKLSTPKSEVPEGVPLDAVR